MTTVTLTMKGRVKREFLLPEEQKVLDAAIDLVRCHRSQYGEREVHVPCTEFGKLTDALKDFGVQFSE